MKFCIVPHCKNEFDGFSGYLFRANGKEQLSGNSREQWGWCKQHIGLEMTEKYMNPVFENKEALELFKKVHPWIYKRQMEKIPLFLDERLKELCP